MVELELLKEDVFQLWKYIRAVKSRQKIGEADVTRLPGSIFPREYTHFPLSFDGLQQFPSSQIPSHAFGEPVPYCFQTLANGVAL